MKILTSPIFKLFLVGGIVFLIATYDSERSEIYTLALIGLIGLLLIPMESNEKKMEQLRNIPEGYDWRNDPEGLFAESNKEVENTKPKK